MKGHFSGSGAEVAWKGSFPGVGQSSGAGDVLELAFLSHLSSISASTPLSGPAGVWLCTAAAPSAGMRLLVLDLPQLMFCYQCWYFLPGTELHHGIIRRPVLPVPRGACQPQNCWMKGVGRGGSSFSLWESWVHLEPTPALQMFLSLFLSSSAWFWAPQAPSSHSSVCACILWPRCCRQGWLHVKAESSKRQFYPDL